jgi:alpha-tubulin suppressor-like RCC1 family protein
MRRLVLILACSILLACGDDDDAGSASPPADPTTTDAGGGGTGNGDGTGTGTGTPTSDGGVTEDGSPSSNDAGPKDVEHFTSVSSGEGFHCALTDKGHVSCWGKNDKGQLGTTAAGPTTKPALVPQLSNVSQISVGDDHTCALVLGSVYCWGDNDDGQLGGQIGGSSSTPTVVAGLSNIKYIAMGGTFSCAVTDTGGVRCWGSNMRGQLGNDSTTNSAVPVEVKGLTNVVQISAGWMHACAVVSGGAGKCWGMNFDGQLGVGYLPNNATYSKVPLDTNVTNFKSVFAGGNHTCGWTMTGEAKCTGWNQFRQLGLASNITVNKLYYFANVDFLTNPSQVAVGFDHNCAIRNNGLVRCWGLNTSGALGDGSTNSSTTGTAYTDLSLADVKELSAGKDNTCAVTNAGAIHCWGDTVKTPTFVAN